MELNKNSTHLTKQIELTSGSKNHYERQDEVCEVENFSRWKNLIKTNITAS